MLKHRVPSAVVMVAGLIAVLWADAAVASSSWPWFVAVPGLVMAVCLFVPVLWLAGREIAVVFHAVGMGQARGALFVGGLAGLVTAVWPALSAGLDRELSDVRADMLGALGPGLLAVVLGWGVLAVLRRGKSAAGALHVIAALAVGWVFLGLTTGAWLWVRAWLGPVGLVGAVMVIKCCDIGAYFTGRFLGRHKLIVWLSPGKTWEGLVGGMALSAAVAVGFCALAPPGESAVADWPWWFAALGGAMLGYVGQLGDLFASAMKRDAGVKDFAKTIPGFGGVMDVIDSLLLAGPVVAAWVWLGGLWLG